VAGKPNTEAETILHATCVSVAGKAVVFTGVSGSGKSSLALNLMALGADLVADDRVILKKVGGIISASAPETISGMIEARGIGLLKAKAFGPAPVACVVDLDQVETARMPPVRKIMLLGQSVTLLFKVDSLHFPAALMQYLKEGRWPEQ